MKAFITNGQQIHHSRGISLATRGIISLNPTLSISTNGVLDEVFIPLRGRGMFRIKLDRTFSIEGIKQTELINKYNTIGIKLFDKSEILVLEGIKEFKIEDIYSILGILGNKLNQIRKIQGIKKFSLEDSLILNATKEFKIKLEKEIIAYKLFELLKTQKIIGIKKLELENELEIKGKRDIIQLLISLDLI